MRKKFDEQFKAMVALEAVKEELTLQEMAEKYQVHPNQISVWKKKLQEQSSALFERKNKKDEEYNQLKKEKEELFRALSEKQVRRLMHSMHLKALHAKKTTSVTHSENPIYPYLLKNIVVRYPNQVWISDLTYITLPGLGYVYLVAIMDLYSRKVLSWKVSNSMDSLFCEEALKEAIARFGVPALFNTDQGSQFTSNSFTQILQDHGIRISMDGCGRWRDNVHIERLWRTVKYEDIYLQGYENVRALKRGLASYFDFYNRHRFHQNLDYETPDQRYRSFQAKDLVA